MLMGIYAVLVLLFLLIGYLITERIIHKKHIQALPIRIWVNGSRGKSSVTRLIAAGLRAKYEKVIAKTTGTAPRFIVDNTTEYPVIRLGLANIREQIRIFKKAIEERPAAVVLECMALRPDLQKIESKQIVEPTAVVITNIRPDHLDVMGPTVKDIAKTFVETIPKNCPLFTNEGELLEKFKKKLKRQNSKLIKADPEKVPDSEVKKFPYWEHKENICLALEVCRYFGVEKKKALQYMQKVTPDPGALRRYKLRLNNQQVLLVNAMAANDPESTHRIWKSLNKDHPEVDILINCRNDRLDRSLQIAELLKNHLNTASRYILTGSGTDILEKRLTKTFDKDKIVNLGGAKPHQTVDAVSQLISDESLLFAIGNTVGYGAELIKEFLKHQEGKC
ncbi:MAG TPA: poly-gamma-glutamate synthase PgsB [candidate division WOR-3 bacterium]|uniref:Poly-gamma-glutamate synthase PgsB n=1 Tax=candidate division WOR-3 bacterium TaxID=2052148 RepID=A0A9C9K006_UNCW3|nr:poly-gamma-glutamate synthase PgsB [candidate division WOR-3 bacterium]